jgi:predicted transcriptional regulator YheO
MNETVDRQATYETLKRAAVAIESLFHPLCEVVIHDFTDLDHSIIHIQGNVTNRSVGGAATDLLLKQVKSDTKEDYITNYLTTLPGGRLMKSTTMFLRDQDDQVFGAFCINFQVSDFMGFEKILTTFLSTDNNVSEVLTDDINETLQALISETLYDMGSTTPLLTKGDKIELIRRLEDKGVFQVKRSVTLLAHQLGISRATVYNYLREARH